MASNYNELETLLKRLYGTQPDQSQPEPFDAIPVRDGVESVTDGVQYITADRDFKDNSKLFGAAFAQLVSKAQTPDKLTVLERRLIGDLTVSVLGEGLAE